MVTIVLRHVFPWTSDHVRTGRVNSRGRLVDRPYAVAVTVQPRQILRVDVRLLVFVFFREYVCAGRERGGGASAGLAR